MSSTVIQQVKVYNNTGSRHQRHRRSQSPFTNTHMHARILAATQQQNTHN